MRIWKRISALLLALLLAAGPLSGAVSAEPILGASWDWEGVQSFTAPDTVQCYADDELVTAIVLLEGQAASAAGVPMRGNPRLARQHNALRTALRRSQVAYTEKYDYTALFNGMAITVAYGELDRIAALPGVRSVHVANTYNPPETVKMDSSNDMTGAARLQASGFQGSGTVIAVLDTGVTPQHEAFGVYEGMLSQATLTEEKVNSVIGELGYGSYLSQKIPFAYDYADLDDDATDDTVGHGTHVSAIAAGWAQTEEGVLRFCGAAPDAQLLAMKVFPSGGQGTDSSIYFKALEDAYLLGADVINMSLGSYSGFSYDAELENEVFGNIYQTLRDQGVALVIAAGNEGSMGDQASNKAGPGYLTADYADYGTVDAPSTYAPNLSVASAENEQYPYFTLKAGDRSIRFEDATGSRFYTTLTELGDQAEFAVVPGVGSQEDFEGLMVQGRIALVARGELSFQEKARNAAKAGAIALLVYNSEEGRFAMAMEDRELPAASITKEDGEYLISLAQTVEPPEPEVFTELRYEDKYYASIVSPDWPFVLAAPFHQAALTNETKGDGLNTLPVTIEEEIGEEEETRRYLTAPVELAYTILEDEEEGYLLQSSDGGYLSAAPVGGLVLLEEPSAYSRWEFEDVEDVEPETETYIGCGKYLYTLADPEGPLYLHCQDGVVNCAALDESRRDDYVFRFFYDPREPDFGPEPVATDIGPLLGVEEPKLEQSENGWRMSSFSSWGSTPDLGFKPQITAIGGNVYAASFGSENGYELMSGTSMATPDLAGILADLLQALKEKQPDLAPKARMELAEAMLESGARLLTDADGSFYSPRRQGAGLVDLDNTTRIKAYLPEPLLALGAKEDGVYDMGFTVRSLGQAVSYRVELQAMTDKLEELAGGRYNCLRPEALTEADFSLSTNLPENIVSVPAGGEAEVKLSLRLSDSAKARFAEGFPNGNFVEGFITLTEVEKPQEPPTGDFRFDDVRKPSRFYFKPVYWAYEHLPQITAGVTETSFAPNEEVTRGQVVTFLWRAAGKPEPSSAQTPFTDVPSGRFYTKAVLWALEQGITKGSSPNRFEPEASCTRGELVTFLYRFAKKPALESGAKNPFTDVTEGRFYYSPVLWALERGITKGVTETSFAPLETCTRGETVTFLYRMLAEPAQWQQTEDGASIHASYMGFFGDWTQAPMAENVDWRSAIADMKKADQTGVFELSQGEVNTLPNTAVTMNLGLLQGFGMMLGGYAGDNFYGEVPYYEDHNVIAPGGVRDTLFAIPMLLRNARRLIMTVTDTDSGELVSAVEQEYAVKAYYNPQSGSWSGSALSYDGTNLEGEFLPNNSKLRVDFYAESVNGADVLGSLEYAELGEKAGDYCFWSFPLTIDTELPSLEILSYDPEAKTLRIRIRDNQYLMAMNLGHVDPETGEPSMIESYTYSDPEPGLSHELVLKNVEEEVYLINLYDYGMNGGFYQIQPGEGEFVRIGLNYVEGTQPTLGVNQILAAVGSSVPLSDLDMGMAFDSRFLGWSTAPQEQGLLSGTPEAEDFLDRLTAPGDSFLVTGPGELYAAYEFPVRDAHVLLQQLRDELFSWDIVMAIGGCDRENEEQVFFLRDDGSAVALDTELDEEDNRCLRGAEDALLFQVEEQSAPESGLVRYSLRAQSSGKYLAREGGKLCFTEELSDDALWLLGYAYEENMCALMSLDENSILAYNRQSGAFELVSVDDYVYEDYELSFYHPTPYTSAYGTVIQ